MQKKKQNLALPEFTFWEATCHQGNLLKGRTIVEHVRSHTVVELFFEPDFKELVFNPEVKTMRFDYVDSLGAVEEHTMAVHFSLADDTELPAILEKIREWYVEYLAWEDRNILEDEQGELN